MIMNVRIVFLILCSGIAFCLKAQESQLSDKAIFDRYLTEMSSRKSLPAGDLMVETARFFIGCPYVASTLEKEPESLVVNLREMDCMTLVETTMALVRTLLDKEPTFDRYRYHLQEARYRNGKINDYTDRLHYTTDWIFENEQSGRVKDVTCAIGGKPLKLNLSFMSTHPDSYKPLKNHPERIARIAEKEKEINARSYCYIPETEIDAHAAEIDNGDIVCFVTTVKGLDISHVGIICREAGKLTFIHASTSKKQVIVNEESLQDYVQSIKRNSGIMIVRPRF